MSRIGKQPIPIPDNVTIKDNGKNISVSGPKGELHQSQLEGIICKVDDNQCLVSRLNESQELCAKHGLMRSLIANMIIGVSEGFEKQLELIGIGYKVRLEGQTLVLNIGFSHEVRYEIAEDITPQVEGNNIKLTGIDKQKVGQVAATIRDFKKPEPYKGKGIRYKGENVRRKSGKGSKE